MKSNYLIFTVLGCLISFFTLAQSPQPNLKVEPAFWWVGMKNTKLQLLVYAKDIAKADVSLAYKGVKIDAVTKVENPNYLFVTLNIAPETQAGKFQLVFTKSVTGKKGATQEKLVYDYELKAKQKDPKRIQGVDASDLVYLIMPDRFANGDPSNDSIKGMNEGYKRSFTLGRHGGDLKGIEQKLDYIQNLGVTTLWLNPVLENNQDYQSYHGYAITDFYKVDARFGSNEDYLRLVNQCHAKGMKMIMDMVFNHCGSRHWFYEDLPTADWVNPTEMPNYNRSNFRGVSITDPYASAFDQQKMAGGWFDKHMPDLNQRNPLLATYLIQNTIWWIEYAGLDGLRIDTYPYPYKEFMAEWTKAVLAEYPQLYIVGEVWVENPVAESYWHADAPANTDGYNTKLPSITDFPLYFALNQAFHEKDGWNEGLARFYYVLLQDRVYADPYKQLIFPDNHDVTRYFTAMGKDMRKYKMGLALMATMRGIPQVYYATELAMEGESYDHGLLRKDFPGGWAGDPVNAFTREGRSAQENEAFDFFAKLFNWRKTKEVLHTGKFMHFIPEYNGEYGIYVYFRYTDNDCVMVIFNNTEEERTLKTSPRYNERLKGYQTGYNPITGERLSNLSEIKLPAKSATILDLD